MSLYSTAKGRALGVPVARVLPYAGTYGRRTRKHVNPTATIAGASPGWDSSPISLWSDVSSC
jgi:hypothetical protein